MQEETKVWKIVIIGFCTFVATIGGCNATTNHQDNTAMVEMVSRGADPIDARCAVKDSSINVFVIRAATKNRAP